MWKILFETSDLQQKSIYTIIYPPNKSDLYSPFVFQIDYK
jgi:hypothetical protein